MQLKVAVLVHWLGVIWHLVAQIEIYFGETSTWIQVQDLEDTDWFSRYVASFYSALATSLLIGASGNTTVENVLTISFLFGTVGVFAYILSFISLIIQAINQKSQDFKLDMELINSFMRENCIENKTQIKIRSYLEYTYQDSYKMKHNLQVKQVLHKLPKLLNHELIEEINLRLLLKIEYFKKNFSLQTLQRLSSQAEELHVVTNGIIIDQMTSIDEKDDQATSIYIINHGAVEICIQDHTNKLHSIKKLKEGDIFGDINFITGNKHPFIVRSSTFTTLLKIKRESFIKLLRNNMKEYEKFCYMKDQLIFTGQTDRYIRQCFICNSKHHFEHQCRLLCDYPFEQLLHLKNCYQDWRGQDRQRYLRIKIQLQAFKELDNLQNASEQIIESNNFEDFIKDHENYLIETILQDIQQIEEDIFESQNELMEESTPVYSQRLQNSQKLSKNKQSSSFNKISSYEQILEQVEEHQSSQNSLSESSSQSSKCSIEQQSTSQQKLSQISISYNNNTGKNNNTLINSVQNNQNLIQQKLSISSKQNKSSINLNINQNEQQRKQQKALSNIQQKNNFNKKNSIFSTQKQFNHKSICATPHQAQVLDQVINKYKGYNKVNSSNNLSNSSQKKNTILNSQKKQSQAQIQLLKRISHQFGTIQSQQNRQNSIQGNFQNFNSQSKNSTTNILSAQPTRTDSMEFPQKQFFQYNQDSGIKEEEKNFGLNLQERHHNFKIYYPPYNSIKILAKFKSKQQLYLEQKQKLNQNSFFKQKVSRFNLNTNSSNSQQDSKIWKKYYKDLTILKKQKYMLSNLVFTSKDFKEEDEEEYLEQQKNDYNQQLFKSTNRRNYRNGFTHLDAQNMNIFYSQINNKQPFKNN